MFRLTVQDVFSIANRGTVVTGKVEAGSLRKGDEVQINGQGSYKVDGIEAFRKILDEAKAGENVGLLFSSLTKQDIRPGAVISVGGPVARDPRFADAEAQRRQFLSMREAGIMTTEQVDESLRNLMFGLDGRYWVLTTASDQWFASEGDHWVPATPP